MRSLFRIEHAEYGHGPFWMSGSRIARSVVPVGFDELEGWPTVYEDHWKLGAMWRQIKEDGACAEWFFAFTRLEVVGRWFPNYSPSAHAPFQIVRLQIAARNAHVGKDQAIFRKEAVLTREALYA